MAKNYAYLMYVDSLDNHNKYYEITQNDDDSIDVKYGRVGSKEMRHHYASYEKDFYTLKASKESKGYNDVTALHASKSNTNDKMQNELSYEPIENEDVDKTVSMLIKSAREFMRNNYTVKPAEITQKMVSEAVRDLDELRAIANGDSTNKLYSFNKALEELFTDIPRRMSNVSAYLAKTSADFSKIIEREQNMLDNVRGQIIETKQTKKDGTVLEAYGLSVKPVTYKEEDEITAHLGKDYNGTAVENRFVKAYAVENANTREKYEQFKQDHNLTSKDVRLFYHGSKVENWWSIMKQGLSLNPNASVTGKMFGNGLYFASESRKSLNYMDTAGSVWNNGQRDSGFMAIYSVALGKCYKPTGALSSSFNANHLPQGCLSVYADKHMTGLRNDEYIVYRQEQCTIKYLVEMTKANVREKTYNLDRKAVQMTSKQKGLSAGLEALIKTSDGVKAEVILSKLSDKCRSEIERCVSKGSDNLTLFYHKKTNTISFEFKKDGKTARFEHMGTTEDDNAFLCREMKKAFAESEDRWKDIMEEAKIVQTGKTVLSKNNEKPLKKSKANIELD